MKKRILSIILCFAVLFPLAADFIDFRGITSYAVEEETLASHIETERVVNPDGVTVNLFDYWVNTEKPTAPQGDILTKDHSHKREDGSSAGFSSQNDWNRGINEGHLLIFGDGIIHAGLWNKGAGENTNFGKTYAGTENIVRPLLENGYPVINTAAANLQLTGDKGERNWELIKDWKLAGDHDDPNVFSGLNIKNLSDTVIGTWGKNIGTDTESLDYLFDPAVENPYKRTYENIKGLFQLDDDGYYYYNMRKNFAEFNYDPTEHSDGNFILYDAAATVRSDGTNSIGNFFPFNKGTEVFSGVDADGNLTSNVACSRNTMNHHLGMTIDIDFRQPTNGTVNMGTENAPMVFEFSGDDDVWVFIDGVLVLDLGGVHSEIYGSINFSTGDVYIGRSFETKGIPEDPTDPTTLVTHTNLKTLFETAGKDSSTNWNRNTFASNSDHTLQMFYLERGNYDSSLALRFNIQPRLYQQIKKVDQYGNPVEGVSFDLYAAQEITADGKTEYRETGDCLATLTTGEDGMSRFEEPDAGGESMRPFNFTDRYVDDGIQYYILKERNTPAGYRPLPIDIVLKYQHDSSTLRVVNRYTTGAYSSFISTIYGNSNISYGQFDPTEGAILATDNMVSADIQENGLAVAIPMIYENEISKWKALYGNNTNGQHAVTPEGRDVISWRKAVLAAVLHQSSDIIQNSPDWYLSWSEENKRLEGTLSDLPGRADRYKIIDSAGDMQMVYAIIDPKVFDELIGQSSLSSEEKYEALGAYVRSKMTDGKTIEDAVKEAVEEIYGVQGENSRGFSFLNVDQFNRNFRSLIYIPNEQRELRLYKVDENGRRVNGSVFGLYCVSENPEINGTLAATGVTANIDGEDGILIFRPDVPAVSGETVPGYAEIKWAASVCDRYILKELSAPEGYKTNPTEIPIVVGTYSIYADAGIANDGVKVMAGVGKLAQTMVKYAADEEVNITLRDIKAIAQTQPSGNYQGIEEWEDDLLEGTDIPRFMNLHYGKNAVVDYGLHDEDGGLTTRPFFVTDEGFLRAKVYQNYPALTGELYGSEAANNTANKDYIGDEEITSLFSLLNIIVVTDETDTDAPEDKTGQLTVSKKLTGNTEDGDYEKLFRFKVELTEADGKPLTDEYYFYGTDKSGFIENGGTVLLHHDESITILGLPHGTKFKITEEDADNWNTFPESRVFEGSITRGVTSRAVFVNSREKIIPAPGKLSISKKVTGEENTEKEFTFTVTLTDKDGKELSEAFNYSGSKTGSLRSGDSVKLKHGEKITIENIPEGTNYAVAEEEVSKDGYISRSADSKGTIVTAETVEAAFVNEKNEENTGSLKVTKTVAGYGDETEKFNFTVILSDTALNGKFGDITFENGTARFTLTHGETKTAEGLPAGTHYAVTEEEANQNGYTTTVNGSRGEILKGEETKAEFVNTKTDYGTGSLTVSKTVTGDGDKTVEFNFTVTLSDNTLSGTFGDMTFENGIAKFRLSHGETKTAAGIPENVRYTVTEEEANKDGYETTATGDEGRIVKDTEVKAVFVNDKKILPDENKGNISVSKTVTGNGDKNEKFHFTVTLSDNTLSGTFGDMIFDNGIAVFVLSHGETAIAVGLPEGIDYAVTESEANQDGYVTTASGSEGQIEKDKTASVVFVNSKVTISEEGKGNLTVSKTVTGDGDKNAEFTFTVTLSDKTVNGKFGDMTFKDGSAEFRLKHGESATAIGLPKNTAYTVTETEADKNGYVTTAENSVGNIENRGNQTVVFVNHKEPNKGGGKTPTTSDNKNTVAAVIMVVSMIALLTTVIVRRKKENDR